MGELGDNGVLSGSLKAPLTVTNTFLEPARSRCSHSHTPCHVPRFNLPSDTGTVRLEPRKHAFTWAGMSSGPSHECLNGKSSGTILLSIISMSARTSGSQFSLIARLADVCNSWMCIRPTANWDNSGSCLSISSVTRCTPRCCGLRWIFRCSHAGWPTMSPGPTADPEPLLWLAEQAILPLSLLHLPLTTFASWAPAAVLAFEATTLLLPLALATTCPTSASSFLATQEIVKAQPPNVHAGLDTAEAKMNPTTVFGLPTLQIQLTVNLNCMNTHQCKCCLLLFRVPFDQTCLQFDQW